MSLTDIDVHVAALWRDAGRALGIAVVTPFAAIGPRGDAIDALVWLRDFGAPRGALVCTADDPDELASRGIEWGYEVVDHDLYAYPAHYEHRFFLQILTRLGWSGSAADRPSWLPAAAPVVPRRRLSG